MSNRGPATGPQEFEQEVMHCEKCQLPLPLKLAARDERGMNCRCTGCGAEYWGNIDTDRALKLAGHIAPADTRWEGQALEGLLPPDAVADLIGELLENYEGPERRASVRRRITMGVSAQPVDEQFNPMGDSFVAITLNISVGGVSLMHNCSVSAPYIILELPSPRERQVKTRLQVLRCQRFEGFYEITGQFVVADHDTNMHQARDIKLSPAAWQAIDAVALQLRRTPDCVLQSLVLGERSQARRCLTRYLTDMAEKRNQPARS